MSAIHSTSVSEIAITTTLENAVDFNEATESNTHSMASTRSSTVRNLHHRQRGVVIGCMVATNVKLENRNYTSCKQDFQVKLSDELRKLKHK